jgi:GR25 family glycosyltransferase involved in LPS biosynthesis
VFRGYFINLDRSVARRCAIVEQLAAAGLAGRYIRFPAVDGSAVSPYYRSVLSPGELGTWLSHERLLNQNRSCPHHLHVIEDDIVLAGDARMLFERALSHADADFPDWDLLFTDVHVPLDPSIFRRLRTCVQGYELRREHSIMDIGRIDFAGMTSYFVNSRSVGKVHDQLRSIGHESSPVDLCIRNLVRDGRLNACLTVPFLTSLSPIGDFSEIRGPTDRSRRVCGAYRRSFFISANLSALAAEIEKLVTDICLDSHTALFIRAQEFSLSTHWREF